MARPVKKLTAEQIKECETLGALLSLEQIADYFGVARNTFSAICERQPEVIAHYKKGKSRAIGSVAKGLLGQAKAGNIAASIFYLKTQAGWREVKESDAPVDLAQTLRDLADKLPD